jgi:ubiquinone/menaquinone biosynthesis C-methylase UbiE
MERLQRLRLARPLDRRRVIPWYHLGSEQNEVIVTQQRRTDEPRRIALADGYRCPECASRELSVTEDWCRCEICAWMSQVISGIPSLTRSDLQDGERRYYDEVYATAPPTSTPMLDPSSLEQHWCSLYYPMNAAVLEELGRVQGKEILLLGNGGSEKELYFLTRQPKRLIFSDLSPIGVRLIRDRLGPDWQQASVEFVAIDALNLPLVDDSVDLVYGYAFVHHLNDIDRFLTEVHRILRPGGRCVFMDDAYSPAWQTLKMTALYPLMRYFHQREEISPEDVRATTSGWYREDELDQKIRSIDARPFFRRSSLVHYLFTRASERLPPERLWKFLVGQDGLLRALIRIDEILGSSRLVRKNQVRLVWGFEKVIRA